MAYQSFCPNPEPKVDLGIKAILNAQLTLDQSGFEVHRSTYTRIFSNKYSKCIFSSLRFLFSTLPYCKNTVHNTCNLQNLCQLTVDVIGKASSQW